MKPTLSTMMADVLTLAIGVIAPLHVIVPENFLRLHILH